MQFDFWILGLCYLTYKTNQHIKKNTEKKKRIFGIGEEIHNIEVRRKGKKNTLIAWEE